MMGPRSGLPQHWNRFFFEPATPLDLGVCRMVFFGVCVLCYLGSDVSEWALVSDRLWMPIGPFQVLQPPTSVAGLASMQAAWLLSLVCACAGLLTRASTFSAFVLGTYLLGLPHNFGKVHHFDALLVLVLAIMALSRCGDAWSVDSILRRRGRLRPAAQPSGEYTWPIRAVWVMFALVFFGAGVSKLRHSGLDWVFSATMSNRLRDAGLHLSNADPLTSMGSTVASWGPLPMVMAAVALAIELAFPLAVFHGRARWVLVPAACALQVAIRLLMGPTFHPFLACYAFWIPWDRVVRRTSSMNGHDLVV